MIVLYWAGIVMNAEPYADNIPPLAGLLFLHRIVSTNLWHTKAAIEPYAHVLCALGSVWQPHLRGAEAFACRAFGRPALSFSCARCAAQRETVRAFPGATAGQGVRKFPCFA